MPSYRIPRDGTSAQHISKQHGACLRDVALHDMVCLSKPRVALDVMSHHRTAAHRTTQRNMTLHRNMHIVAQRCTAHL
eukprot:6001520-Pyramimonas_sp.AAC.1